MFCCALFCHAHTQHSRRKSCIQLRPTASAWSRATLLRCERHGTRGRDWSHKNAMTSRIPTLFSARTLCTLVLTMVLCGRSVHFQTQTALFGQLNRPTQSDARTRFHSAAEGSTKVECPHSSPHPVSHTHGTHRGSSRSSSVSGCKSACL